MQDTNSSNFYMTMIYKENSSSLHDFNLVKLKFLKLSLKEK